MNIIKTIFGSSEAGAVTSLGSLLLRLSGMRFTIEYEIVTRGDEAELSLYEIRFTDGADRRRLEKRTCCPAEEILAVLNRCEVLCWDGFFGRHPKHVTDGTMFTLTADVNGGRRIRAEGSQNFPKHFREFEDALRLLLDSTRG